MLAAHRRNPLRAELAANATIMRMVKDEAERTRLVPRRGAGASAGPAPAAPPPGLSAPPPATLAPPVADVLERPGYYLYYGVPYGTGSDIPGGRR